MPAESLVVGNAEGRLSGCRNSDPGAGGRECLAGGACQPPVTELSGQLGRMERTWSNCCTRTSIVVVAR